MLPFDRQDPTSDALFYAQPRLVTHIGDGAIEALRSFYAELLDPQMRVLDLMSSWRSHLPEGVAAPHGFSEVVGLGMNEIEMDENPQLDAHVVHDLNVDWRLPFAEDSFDAAICTVSIQYLVEPDAVLTDVGRVVRAGGPVVCAFSNRCFPTKAVAIWCAGGDAHHMELVQAYFEHAGFERIQTRSLPSTDDPVLVVWAPSSAGGAPGAARVSGRDR